jgi:hypothetical protein
VLAESCSVAPGTSAAVKSTPLTVSDTDQSSWPVLDRCMLAAGAVAVVAQIAAAGEC